jgi:predicted MFS family arabinose efflux permease
MRRTYVLFYALVFLDEIALLSVAPLLPTYKHAFALSDVRAGALLAAASAAIVVASIPAGRLADRFGARRVTIAAAALAGVAMVGFAEAPNFALLLATRAAFGVGSGTIWSAGISWLGDSTAPVRRDRALAAVITVAGVGSMTGPVFAGLMADHVDRGAAFAVVGVGMVAVAVAMAVSDPGRRVRHDDQPLLAVAAGMRTDPSLAGAIAIMLLGGVSDGVISLVAPLQLGHLGLSSAAIGAWFSASSAIFIASSAVVARLGQRAVSLRGAGLMAGLQAAGLVPVVLAGGAPIVVAMVLVRAVVVAPPYTIAFPLGALGAGRLGFGTGTVNGLMGVVWGAADFAGPLLAGVIVAGPGSRVAYALLAVYSLLLAVALLRQGRREAAVAAAAAP